MTWQTLLGDAVTGVIVLAGIATVAALLRSLERDIRHELRPAPIPAQPEVPRWPAPPAEPDVWHCERCGLPPDPEQRAAIAADPALARVHAEPWRFRVHWYCPRCAPLGATTTSGVAAWDGKS